MDSGSFVPGVSTDGSSWDGVWQNAYEQYYIFWIRQARRVSPSYEAAEDVLHSVLAQILQDRERTFSSPIHLRNYVAKAVLNRSIDVRKRSSGYEKFHEESGHFLVHDAFELRHDVPTMRTMLVRALAALPPHLYAVLKCRYFAGFTFKQAREFLQVPVSTLKSREDAALRRIRKYLERNGCA
jgi:RNA polymerase sigma factor (sigma-70 family)